MAASQQPPFPPRPTQARRRSSSSRRSSSTDFYDGQGGGDDVDEPSTPLAPPTLAPEDEELEELIAARQSGEHSLGGWHYAPLLVGVLPPLGSLFGGNANTWSDGILLFLASFWLFQCLKIPQDIYHAARTRRILQADQLGEDIDGHKDSPERIRRRQLAIVELQRVEIMALLACVASPIVGAYILHWLQQNLTDGQRYLNHFNIRLFTMAAGIRPWIHAFKLLRRRLLLLQEDVHYPSAKVESLQRRIVRLEADLSSLRKSSVSKADVRLLRDGIDVPLSQMSRSMRRYEKKEEYLRASSDDKFALVESRLEDLLRECAINAELIESERLERERSSSLGRNVLEAFKFAIGQRSSASSGGGGGARGLPPSSSFASITNVTSPTSPPGAAGSPPWTHARLRSNSNSSNVASSMMTTSSSTSSLPAYASQAGSPPRYPATFAGHANGASTYTPEQQQQAGGAVFKAEMVPEWYERGMLYWAFLPLNLSNSVLRYAGDRLSSSQHQQVAQRGRRMIGPAPPPPASTVEGYAALQQQQHSLNTNKGVQSPPAIQVTHSSPQPANGAASSFDSNSGGQAFGAQATSPTHAFGASGVVTSSPIAGLPGSSSVSSPWKSMRGGGRAVKA